MSKIDLSKEYKTRDGREVKIYAIYPHEVHGACIDNQTGDWDVDSWDEAGMSYHDSACHLIEVKPVRKLEMWVNVYEAGPCTTHDSRGDADISSSLVFNSCRIACLHIVREYTEGEGL